MLFFNFFLLASPEVRSCFVRFILHYSFLFMFAALFKIYASCPSGF